MALVRNPLDVDLFCVPLRAVLRARAEVEVSDAVANELRDGTVFVVIDLETDEPSVVPVRRNARRGAKEVETTQAPIVETR